MPMGIVLAGLLTGRDHCGQLNTPMLCVFGFDWFGGSVHLELSDTGWAAFPMLLRPVLVRGLGDSLLLMVSLKQFYEIEKPEH